jgi:hypothetical protein
MAILSPLPGAVTAITISPASLANNVGRQSAMIDNTIIKAVDAIVQFKIKNGTGTAGTIELWTYGSADKINYSAGAGTTDVNFTPSASAKSNMRLLDLVTTPTNAGVYVFGPVSIGFAWGGTMPLQWGIWLFNNGTGAALDATAGNFVANYTPIQLQIL